MADTKTATPRVARNASVASSFNFAALADALSASGATHYGVGQSGPIYDMIQKIGSPSRIINDAATALQTHAEVVEALKDGEGAVTVSVFGDREAFSLAVKSGKGVYYFSLLHDKDGQPITSGQQMLAKVRVNRDFKNPAGEVIMLKGRELFKSMPVAYAETLKAA